MKKIVLAKKGKRIGAAFVDFALIAGVFSALYFPLIFPSVLDEKTYSANRSEEMALLLDSHLYVQTGTYDAMTPQNLTSFTTLVDVNKKSFDYNSQTYTVSLSKNLYLFYTSAISKFDGHQPLSYAVYCSDILKVGSDESNIGSFVVDEANDSYTLTLKTVSQSARDTTLTFFDDAYTAACKIAAKSSEVQALESANSTIMRNAILWAIPTLFGVGFLFEFLVPLFSRNGKSVGKWLFHLVVLSQDGYELKKIWLLPRFLVYILGEIILGVASFGAVLLISYTMFMFTRKRRCLHDYASNSVVAEEKESFWFISRDEEEEYERAHPTPQQ